MNTTTIPTASVDSIWAKISGMSDSVKLELINRISASMLNKTADNKTRKRERFLSLAGAWNSDHNADAMDKATLDRQSLMTRDFNFGD